MAFREYSGYMEYMDRIDYHGQFVDLKGRPVKKTPHSNPYDYDLHVVWMGHYDPEKASSSYSDRMQQWDPDKFKECWKKVSTGQGIYAANKDPVTVNKFLNLYFGYEVKITAIMQGCNKNSGFPFWLYIYEVEKKEEKVGSAQA